MISSSPEVYFEVMGEELLVNEEPFIEVKIIDKRGIPPEIKEEIHRALELSPFDETIRKHLGFMIVNEIAKKYNYDISMEDIDKEDWKKGSVIKITMPISLDNDKKENE